MVLAQFVITSANNGTMFAIGIQGKCSIRVLGVQYHDTAAAGTSRVIKLNSDALYFPYSPARFLTWVTNNSGQMSFDNSRNEYHLQNVVLNSQIYLQVLDNATNAVPGGFQWCVVSLDIEKVDKEFQ